MLPLGFAVQTISALIGNRFPTLGAGSLTLIHPLNHAHYFFRRRLALPDFIAGCLQQRDHAALYRRLSDDRFGRTLVDGFTYRGSHPQQFVDTYPPLESRTAAGSASFPMAEPEFGIAPS